MEWKIIKNQISLPYINKQLNIHYSSVYITQHALECMVDGLSTNLGEDNRVKK